MRLLFLLLFAGCASVPHSGSSSEPVVNSVFKIARYKDGVLQGNASGVAVKKTGASTLILTNRHVCHDRGNSDYLLVDNNLGEHRAVYYAVHDFADLCVLKTTDTVPVVEFGSSVIDEKVVSIGAPNGVFPIFSNGVVKAPVRINSSIAGENYFFLAQSVLIDNTDGNSGSPVFNLDQKVVGIIFGTTDGRNSFMVPSSVILPFLQNMTGQ